MLIDVIAIVLILACLIYGVKKGLVKTLFGTLSLVAAMLLTGWTLPAFTAWMTDTKVGETVREKTEITIVEQYGEENSSDALHRLLEKAGLSVLRATEQEASVRLFNMVMRAMSACILFFGYMFLLKLLAWGLNAAAKLPVLHTFNRLGGFAAGVANAYLLLTAFAILIPVILSISPNDALREQFEQSTVLTWFLIVNPFL